MAAFVTDSSVAAAWLMPDENNQETAVLMDLVGEKGAVAPLLLWYETANLLLVASRRGRIEESEIGSRFDIFKRLAIGVAEPSDQRIVFLLASKYNLSGYDATFLALAMELALPLATSDKKLIAAARNEGILVLPEASN